MPQTPEGFFEESLNFKKIAMISWCFPLSKFLLSSDGLDLLDTQYLGQKSLPGYKQKSYNLKFAKS